jgi:diamine N-acetyltransferase
MNAGGVTFREITSASRAECEALRVSETQRQFIAPNAASLHEADGNASLRPFGVYDDAERGLIIPRSPMLGFVMLEFVASVGFIYRLMIGERYQGRGYGRLTLQEAIRRLRLHPEVEMIASSYRRENSVMGRMLGRANFVTWDVAFAEENPGEAYVRLPSSPY